MSNGMQWEDVQVRIPREFAEDLLLLGDGIERAPGIRGSGLDVAEVLIVSLGITSNFVTLVLARSAIADFARRLRELALGSDLATIDIELRQGDRRVKVSVRTDEPDALVAPIQDLVASIRSRSDGQ